MPSPSRRSFRVVSLILSVVLAGACSSGGTSGSGGAPPRSTSTGGGTGSGGATGGGGATSSGATGSSGGAGGAETCTPGATRSCYTGPAGTQNVGLCKSGTQACNASGVGYGPCAGEVIPKPESCFTPDDDDCNGQANEGCLCAPGTDTACYTGPAGTQDVGLCKAGKAVCDLTGKAYGPCFGQTTPQAENCASPADENCDGQTPPCAGVFLLARALGGPFAEAGYAVAADASGNVVIAGTMSGGVDIGCGPLPGSGPGGGFIAKLDPGGACLWSKRLGDDSSVSAVATDVAGDVFLAGSFAGPIDLGGLTLSAPGETDALFAKLDASGAPVWARQFGDAALQSARGIAVDDAGNVVGVGLFHGTIDFGSGPHPSQGGADIFVVKLDAAGALLWDHTFGDADDQAAAAVAIDATYSAVVTGTVGGTVDFGGGPLTSAGLGDVFVARFDSTGDHLWSRLYGDANDQSGAAVRADAQGNLYVAGAFDGTIDLGGAAYTTGGGQDAFLLALDAGGHHRWSRQVGAPGAQSAAALAVDRYGNVAFGGVLTGTADAGTGPLTSVGPADIFVGKYDPAGKPLWSASFGDTVSKTYAPALKGLAFDGQGNLLLTGILTGPADFGGGPVTPAGSDDAFLAKLAP